MYQTGPVVLLLDMTDLLNNALAEASWWLTSGTIAANTAPLLFLALVLGWFGAMVPGPRGPLYTCACGKTMRQGGKESRTAFRRRHDAHTHACEALTPHLVTRY